MLKFDNSDRLPLATWSLALPRSSAPCVSTSCFSKTHWLIGIGRDLKTGNKVTLTTASSGNVITKAQPGKPGLLVCENVGNTAADVGLVSLRIFSRLRSLAHTYH